MVVIRRQPITLLELLVVIAILALASGIVAVSITKAVVDQRFRSEVSLVVGELRLAQDLMLILGADVRVVFAVDKSGDSIEYWLQMDKIIGDHLQREITRRKNKLKTIKGVFFEDELLKEVQQGKIDVQFLSRGAVMSKGVMRLASSDSENPPAGVLQNYICFSGYPRPISSVSTKENADKDCAKNDASFDERLTQDTIAKVPEKVKKRQSLQQSEESRSSDDKKAKDAEKPGSGSTRTPAAPVEGKS